MYQADAQIVFGKAKAHYPDLTRALTNVDRRMNGENWMLLDKIQPNQLEGPILLNPCHGRQDCFELHLQRVSAKRDTSAPA